MRERERVPYKQKYLEQSESEAKEYGSEKKQGVKKQLFRFLLPTEPKTKKKQKTPSCWLSHPYSCLVASFCPFLLRNIQKKCFNNAPNRRSSKTRHKENENKAK